MKTIRKHFLFIALFALGFIAVIALFYPGLPVTHDGPDHVARIANFYKNLSEGIFIPRWAANLNWGYGHPILEFLYPLPSYTASLFHLLGFTFVDSVKIIFGLSLILSGIFMYIWLSSFIDKYPSFIGAVLYMYAPYRFVDLYVRGAIGESAAFIWMPLVLFFIYKLFKTLNFSYLILGAVSLGLLILSHNAISLIYLPFIIFYAVYLLFQTKNKKVFGFNVIILIILGFGLSAFFWFPALIEGKYTLRDIVTKDGYLDRFVNLKDLLYGSWNYGITGQFTVQLGIFHWLAFLGSPLVAWIFYKKKDKKYLLTMGLLIYTVVSIFIMLKESNFIWQKVMILQNFQFPWRFLAIPVFSLSALGALAISAFNKKYIKPLTFSVAIFLFILSINYIKPKDFSYKPESFYTSIYNSTTDTGESSPIWSIRFMEHRPKNFIEIINGNAQISPEKRTSMMHEYKIVVSKKARFVENTLYFPGWQILANGKPVNIEFQDPRYRGLMTFYLDKGIYNVEVVYKNTRVRTVSEIVSALSISFILGFLAFRLIKK